jgi:hypothetical protein
MREGEALACGKRPRLYLDVLRGVWPDAKCSKCLSRLRAEKVFMIATSPDALGRVWQPGA